jgi:hypothetical protein
MWTIYKYQVSSYCRGPPLPGGFSPQLKDSKTGAGRLDMTHMVLATSMQMTYMGPDYSNTILQAIKEAKEISHMNRKRKAGRLHFKYRSQG